jgi:hypothetical protein
MNKHIKTILVAATMAAFIFSCKKDSTTTATPTPTAALEVKKVSNVFANDSSGHFTFFNLRTNTVMNLSDSASTNWDVAFHSTTILVNSGTSGPGNCAASVVQKGFDNVTAAPADSLFAKDNAPTHAIPTGSGNGWYNYDPAAYVITPIAGRTLVVKTADGKYAKIEILSYYKDAPASPTMTDISRYYTFRFSYQSDGTKNLK